MSAALLLHVSDWDAFYIDRKLVDQNHHLFLEMLVGKIIENEIKVFRKVSANDDMPRKDDPLVQFWFVPVEEGETEEQAWQYGWWEFPEELDEATWLRLIADA